MFRSIHMILISSLLGISVQSCAAQKVKRPNIILIMADDLGYGDISCYGSETIQTPNIDKLAAEGIRFTDFHSNGSVCSPTRAALLTGLYQQRVGIDGVVTAKNDRDKGLALDEKTFAESAKEAGYVTGMFGKWHIGYQTKFNPVHQGFDEYIGYVSGNVDYHSHIDQEGYEDWWTADTLKKENGYSTDLITNHAVDFIKRHKAEPFLLYIPHEAPHGPFQGRSSEAIRSIGWKNGEQPKIKRTQEELDLLYKEMVEVMDEGVGKIMETLKDLDLDDNTFVFFCSDNGGIQKVGSNGVLRGYKSTLWEGGHRVPAIARFPRKIVPNQVSTETVLSMDLYPTIIDIIGAAIPSNLDGISLKKSLLENKDLPERELFWAYGGRRSMRNGDWKLLLSRKNADAELYNLKEDLGERNNLAKKYPEKVKSMLASVNSWNRDIQNESKK